MFLSMRLISSYLPRMRVCVCLCVRESVCVSAHITSNIVLEHALDFLVSAKDVCVCVFVRESVRVSAHITANIVLEHALDFLVSAKDACVCVCL